jgi:uncharacterized membrane protein (UPF0127 family)
MLSRSVALHALALLAAFGCALMMACSQGEPASPSGLPIMRVTLPDGTVIRAEVALNVLDQARGMMFREEVRPDAGMLFVFMEEAPRAFWMFRTKIPLDIIWMNNNREIVEISADTPPCEATERDGCPSFGGNYPSRYVLELGAGQAAAHRLSLGDRLSF